jgi:NitT/TauT family transport system ATP-binding protein
MDEAMPEAIPEVLNGSGDQAVEIRRLTMSFASSSASGEFVALQDVTLDVRRGEFLSLVGPTGCGKSTLLSAIAGLVAPRAGEVRIGGVVVNKIPKHVGFIFQQDALLPWRTALQNVELPLRFRGMDRKAARTLAREWLDRVGLARFEKAYPHQMSGGMRKRTAIAATLVYNPSVLLMDESFSSLDIQTRHLMENDLLALWKERGQQTVIFVTHDLEEAIGMSDRVVVLSAGPGRVKGDYVVDLPRPRDLLRIRLAPGFDDIYRKIWSDLEGEVVLASGRR